MSYESQNQIEHILQYYDQELKVKLSQMKYWQLANPPRILLAKNDTFVFYYPSVNRKLLYLQKDGIVLDEIDLQVEYEHICLMADNIVVAWVYDLQLQCNYILQWNLSQKQIIKCKYQNKIETPRVTTFFTFSQSKLLCCLDHSQANNDNTINLSLTYYQFPLNSAEDKPIHEFIFIDTKINVYQFAQKINNHSGIVWRKVSYMGQRQQFIAHIFDLRNQQSQIKTYKLQTLFFKIENQIQAKVLDIWEPKKGQMYVKILVIQHKNKFIKKHKIIIPQQQMVYEFIWIYQKNQSRIPKFGGLINYKGDYNYKVQFINQQRQIKRYNLIHDNSYIHRISQEVHKIELQFQKFPVRYVDFQSESLLAIENGYYELFKFYDKFLKKFQYSQCQYNKNIQIHTYAYKYKANNYINFNIRVMRTKRLIYPSKNIIVHFLLEIIENCDEDLMRQVAYMIDVKQRYQNNPHKWKKYNF